MCVSCSLQVRLNALDEQWQFLVNKSAEKSQKLKEANKQQNFNTGIKDFDFWLSEVHTETRTGRGNVQRDCGGIFRSGYGRVTLLKIENGEKRIR